MLGALQQARSPNAKVTGECKAGVATVSITRTSKGIFVCWPAGHPICRLAHFQVGLCNWATLEMLVYVHTNTFNTPGKNISELEAQFTHI